MEKILSIDPPPAVLSARREWRAALDALDVARDRAPSVADGSVSAAVRRAVLVVATQRLDAAEAACNAAEAAWIPARRSGPPPTRGRGPIEDRGTLIPIEDQG